MATNYAFVKNTKYYNKEQYIEIKEEEIIKEIAATFTHFRSENGELIKSKSFIYNRELEMVHSGEYKFLVNKKNPYLNKTMYKKELETVLKQLMEDQNRVVLFAVFTHFYKRVPASKAEAKEMLSKISYLELKEATDAETKKTTNF